MVALIWHIEKCAVFWPILYIGLLQKHNYKYDHLPPGCLSYAAVW